jgi:hypothetical protein
LPENAVVTRSPADSLVKRTPPASPANAPLTTSAVPPTFAAETPDRCAARALRPNMRSRKPPTDRESHSAMRTASARATTTDRLTSLPKRCRWPNVLLAGSGSPVLFLLMRGVRSSSNHVLVRP